MMKWIELNMPELYALLFSFSISALMGLYDGQSKTKILSGSIVCGFITLAVVISFEYLDLPSNAVVFVGAAIGFIGADKIRNKIIILVENKYGVNKKSCNRLKDKDDV